MRDLIEWKISIGNILSVLGFLCMAVGFVWRVEKRVTVLEIELKNLTEQLGRVEHSINNWITQLLGGRRSV